MRLLYKPFGIIGALIAARLGRKAFDSVWDQIDDAPPPYIEKMLSMIVGFEFSIVSLAGKWKLSQNRRGGERREVEEALLAGPDVEDRRTGEEMRRRRAP